MLGVTVLIAYAMTFGSGALAYTAGVLTATRDAGSARKEES